MEIRRGGGGLVYSNLDNGFYTLGGGRTGLTVFPGYTLHSNSTLLGALTTAGGPFAFDANFNIKWATIVDSTKYGGGFNCAGADINGDLYSNTQVVGIMKYKNYIETTNGNDQKNFPLKLSAVDGQPILRYADIPCGTQNNSTNNVLLQNYIITNQGNLIVSGNLSNNQVIVGTDTAKYYGGNNDMFVMRYGNPCSNTTTMIAAGTPSGLVAKCNGTAISLSWQKLNNGEDKYYIYRSLAANSGFVKIDSVLPTTNTYIDANVVTKTNYWYAISSHNIVGEGYLSMVDSARLCDDIGGINNLTATQLEGQLYPNPTTGEFNLFVQSTEINATAQLQISNYIGQIILNKTVSLKNSNNFKLDVSDYAGGIYLVTLKTAQSRYSEKLILVK